jgi:hypothetical protein
MAGAEPAQVMLGRNRSQTERESRVRTRLRVS